MRSYALYSPNKQMIRGNIFTYVDLTFNNYNNHTHIQHLSKTKISTIDMAWKMNLNLKISNNDQNAKMLHIVWSCLWYFYLNKVIFACFRCVISALTNMSRFYGSFFKINIGVFLLFIDFGKKFRNSFHSGVICPQNSKLGGGQTGTSLRAGYRSRDALHKSHVDGSMKLKLYSYIGPI